MDECRYLAHIATDKNGYFIRQQTCTDHARGVAALASSMLVDQELSCTGYIGGLLHDCGKFTDSFCTYLKKTASGELVKRGSVIHTFAGVRYMLERFHSRKSLTLNDMSAEILAACIGGHHGLIDIWDQQQKNGFEHRLHKQPDYDADAISAFNDLCASDAEVVELYEKAKGEILNFYKMRIVPNVKKEAEGHFSLGLLTRMLTSAIIDADRVDTALFMKNMTLPEGKAIPWESCLNSIDEYIAGFQCISPIQKARSVFSETCAEGALQAAGLYRLDLPTGGGKTLSALRFAVAHAKHNGMHRVFYIAPLLSVIEQNASVLRHAVSGTVQVLEHHSDIIRESPSQGETEHISMLQETWDAPIIVTTLVQLLETLFSGKTSAVRRFHLLSKSVLIIDEVQSLPPRMLTIFNCAINFLTKCCGATVVLCSATQPAFNKALLPMPEPKRLIPESIYNEYAPLFRRTKIIDSGICTIDNVVTLAQSIISNTDSLLIVCNTKKEATELFASLHERSDIMCFHLSAGMCMAHRKEVLQELMKQLSDHARLICVSTQVIEAGIDISFGAVIRFSAGLDNIVQAAGRCNRHGEYGTLQPVHICRLANEKLGSLQEIKNAQNALNALLAEYRLAPENVQHDLTSDEAVRCYYSFLFNGMPRGAQDYPTHGHTLFELLSRNRQFISANGPACIMNQAFRTAGEWFEVFDTDNVTIIVPYREGKAIVAELMDAANACDYPQLSSLLEKAKPFSVSIAANSADSMRRRGALCELLNGTIFVLNEGFYDEETGVKEGNDLCGIQT